MSQILQFAGEYLDCGIKKFGTGIYGLNFADGSFSSLRIFTKTDTAFWYSQQMFLNVPRFLEVVVGLSRDVIQTLLPEIEENALLTLLNTINTQDNNTGLSLQDVVAQQSYNDYLKNERNITEETAQQYGIEISEDDDIYIPLHDLKKFQRVGSLVRSSTCNNKWGHYRTLMIGTHHKPVCWPAWSLKDVTPDTVFIIVEGAFSLMRMQQVCFNKTKNVILLATLTNNFDQQLFDLLYEYDIILIPDNDQGGQKIVEQGKKYKQEGGSIETYLMTGYKGEPVMLDEVDDELLKALMNEVYNKTKFNIQIKENNESERT